MLRSSPTMTQGSVLRAEREAAGVSAEDMAAALWASPEKRDKRIRELETGWVTHRCTARYREVLGQLSQAEEPGMPTGAHLRELRTIAGLTVEQFAELAEVAEVTVRVWERLRSLTSPAQTRGLWVLLARVMRQGDRHPRDASGHPGNAKSHPRGALRSIAGSGADLCEGPAAESSEGGGAPQMGAPPADLLEVRRRLAELEGQRADLLEAGHRLAKKLGYPGPTGIADVACLIRKVLRKG